MSDQVISQTIKSIVDSAPIRECGQKRAAATKGDRLAAHFQNEVVYGMGNELKLYLRLLIVERGAMEGTLDHIADAVATSTRNVRNWIDKLVADGRLETERLAQGQIRISLTGDDLTLAQMEDLPVVESHIPDESEPDPDKDRLLRLYDATKAAGASLTVTATSTFNNNA